MRSSVIHYLAFLCVLVTVVFGCERKPCSDSQPLPSVVEAFIGEWRWEYTVMTSELTINGGSNIEAKDTITPATAGVNVIIRIGPDGCYEQIVGSESSKSYMSNVDYDRQEPSEFSCTEILQFETQHGDFEARSVFYIKCDSIRDMDGGGVPYTLTQSLFPTPELLPGYEIAGFWNYYTRVQ